mmetsp:Transcript_7158/g.9730  ORF Transcript_7158/g.9730 Transcript_7158/m.9730 type:complete len:210 (-) Transcript_7158:97-726(-)
MENPPPAAPRQRRLSEPPTTSIWTNVDAVYQTRHGQQSGAVTQELKRLYDEYILPLELRPFNEFFDSSRFSYPESGKSAERIQCNLTYYRLNYLVIAAVIFGYLLICFPSVIAVLVVDAVMSYGLITYDKPVVKLGETAIATLPLIAFLFFLAVLFIIVITGSHFFACLFLTGMVVVGHSMFHHRNQSAKVAQFISSLVSEINKSGFLR